MNDDPTQPGSDDPTIRFRPIAAGPVEAPAEAHDVAPAAQPDRSAPPAEPFEDVQEAVEVRRDAPLAGVVALLGFGVAVAYLLRGLDSGSTLDWSICVVTAAIGGAFLYQLLDARAPLVVVDRLGVRVRRGQQWQGVAWTEIDRLEHRPRETTLRDGALEVVDDEGRVLGVRLSLSTRLSGCDWHELTDALSDLSGGGVSVLELGPQTRQVRRARDEQPTGGEHAPRDPGSGERNEADEPTVEVDRAPQPGREVSRARRGEVLLPPTGAPVVPGLLARDADAAHEGARDAAHEGGAADDRAIVIHEPLGAVTASEQRATVPLDPVVGPQLAGARTRLGLSVDQLADRTRIRPHVIEAIEVDDFAPCGGDFYARGHLRTLSRVLGLDAEPLLALHAERYADAPIDPRRVFEAELSTGSGAIRGTRGRLNWSVLVAAVMAVVLVWSVARLITDEPAQRSAPPVLNGSPGGSAALTGAQATQVPVVLTAATGGATVQVRDGRQQVVFDDQVAFMQTVELQVRPPVRVSTSDGGLTVEVDGNDEGAIGASGQNAQRIYVPR